MRRTGVPVVKASENGRDVLNIPRDEGCWYGEHPSRLSAMRRDSGDSSTIAWPMPRYILSGKPERFAARNPGRKSKRVSIPTPAWFLSLGRGRAEGKREGDRQIPLEASVEASDRGRHPFRMPRSSTIHGPRPRDRRRATTPLQTGSTRFPFDLSLGASNGVRS